MQVQAITPALALGRRLPYLPLFLRFPLAIGAGLAWASLSFYLALPWIKDLGESISFPVALFAVGGIAIFPGYLNAFLLASLFLERDRPLKSVRDWPTITVLIAAYNEEKVIAETIEAIFASNYPGKIRVFLGDDGSVDKTAAKAMSSGAKVFSGLHSGKAATLRGLLPHVRSSLFLSLDADTLIGPQTLRYLVERLREAPNVAACAAAVMVRNSRANWLARMQSWDYFLGIASIKRSQALWQGTLVAQGSASLFRTQDVREAGAWPDASGEDIVLTWSLLSRGKRVLFEPMAIAFTHVPEDFSHFSRQRIRWARGMVEGIAGYGWSIFRHQRRYWHGVAINALFPWMDLSYTFFFLPGVILFCFGNAAIVGPWTIAVLPLNLLLAFFMYRMQNKSFRANGFFVRKNYLGYLLYLVVDQPVLSALSVIGYVKEFRDHRKAW